VAVEPAKVKSADDGSQLRAAPRIQVIPKKLMPGVGFTRFVLAMARAKGNIMLAHEIAKASEQWKAETPDVETVLKSAVAAGTTTDSTWASPLVQYQNLASEFIEFTRPLTIIGRIPGLRRVPFKVKLPRQTGASTVNWVGEGKVKPISALAFDSVTLDFAKIAGIVVLTDELVRHSSPAAELLVRDDLSKGIVQFMDGQFVDPTKAADDVSPASITNGVTPITASGTNAAALRVDVKAVMQQFLDADLTPSDAVWIMTQGTALSISLMTNDLGQPEFPGITMNGGTFLGLPVVTSESVPGTGGSPTDGGLIILAKAGDILLADDGNVTVDASREASLQMDSAPDSPATASTVLVSMFQQNMMAIRAEREINWKKRRSASVQLIQGCKYADS
jgi:HK97 family phage major capsid protein